MHGGAGGVGTAAIQLAPGRRRARDRDRAQRGARASGVAALGAEVIAPEGFAEHGPFDVILELVGAPNLRREPERARDRRADRRDRRRRRASRPS